MGVSVLLLASAFNLPYLFASLRCFPRFITYFNKSNRMADAPEPELKHVQSREKSALEISADKERERQAKKAGKKAEKDAKKQAKEDEGKVPAAKLSKKERKAAEQEGGD